MRVRGVRVTVPTAQQAGLAGPEFAVDSLYFQQNGGAPKDSGLDRRRPLIPFPF